MLAGVNWRVKWSGNCRQGDPLCAEANGCSKVRRSVQFGWAGSGDSDSFLVQRLPDV